MRLLIGGWAAIAMLLAEQQPPPLEDILKKIAGSQEAAQASRGKIVYTQFVHAKLLRTNGKLAREEKRTYTVTPTAKGFERKLDKFEGWYERGGNMIAYSQPQYHYKSIDIDGELIDNVLVSSLVIAAEAEAPELIADLCVGVVLLITSKFTLKVSSDSTIVSPLTCTLTDCISPAVPLKCTVVVISE